jgi:hypothetical protein
VIFVGNGDFHDSTYEPSAVTGVLGSFAMGTKRNSVVPCTHQITVYATRVNEDSYESNAPFIFAIGAGTCFFFAIVLFLFYDCYVRRQQNRVVGQAERSNAIVASLFPKQVARRLFQDPGRRSGVMDTSNHSANLMNFVTRSERKAANTTVDDRPIAELFPEATVMFGEYVHSLFYLWLSFFDLCKCTNLIDLPPFSNSPALPVSRRGRRFANLRMSFCSWSPSSKPLMNWLAKRAFSK